MSDKVFTKKMTLSICLIILCLCALSISAGAYFSDSKNSQTKTFSTATYNLTVSATKEDNTQNPPTVTVSPTQADEHVYELTADTYTAAISIDTTNTSTQKSGYCKIEIWKSDTKIGTFCTGQIAKDNSSFPTSRSVIIVADNNITVKFVPLWGTYSETYGAAIADGSTLTVAGNTVTVTAP